MKSGVAASDREQPFARSAGAEPPSSASHAPAAAIRCDTKGCPNEPTERVPESKLPHVVYDLCQSCATGMRALQGVELIDARNRPPLTFEPVAAKPHYNACSYCGYLDWTVEKHGRVTHKEGCPMRTDPWHQGDPHPETRNDPLALLMECLNDPEPWSAQALSALVDGHLVGTAVVGNTKARGLHDRYAAEIVRLATDGTFNACSFLYGRARLVWKTMGGDPRKLVTYTLVTEPGTSLEAAGYVRVARVKGREHDTPSRRRKIKGGAQLVDKWRWQAAA